MSVRFAGPGDALAIYELLWEYSQTSELIRQIPADPLRLMEDTERSLQAYEPGQPLEGIHITGICEAEGKPVGGVNMVVDRWFWTADLLHAADAVALCKAWLGAIGQSQTPRRPSALCAVLQVQNGS